MAACFTSSSTGWTSVTDKRANSSLRREATSPASAFANPDTAGLPRLSTDRLCDLIKLLLTIRYKGEIEYPKKLTAALPVASNESNALSNSLLIYRYLRNRLLVGSSQEDDSDILSSRSSRPKQN